MIETALTAQETFAGWSQQIQRRVIRLLLQHDAPLLRSRFHLFTAESKLPEIPLLREYDRYIKLQTLSHTLLDDIMPRIRRQLSLKTVHTRQLEEGPTRGDINWQKSLERSWNHTPGQPPRQFETQQRQRAMDTPENILTVAILLTLQRELTQAMDEELSDEELNQQERQFFASASEQVERELAAAYARALLPQARQASIPDLVQQVAQQSKPDPNPYRDLLNWWERFAQFRVGRTQDTRALTMSTIRQDEKTDAWLYELWIALEFIHLLHENGSLQPHDMTIATDLLQCTFSWQEQRFRFIYNRQLDTSTGYEPTWEHAPASRPDYSIEREEPLTVHYQGQQIWRESAVVFDAKYYLGGSDPTNTHQPIKKLLGDMTLLGATTGALFFPNLPEPSGEQQSTRVVRSDDQHYHSQQRQQQVHLYHLDPSLPFAQLQQRLRALLDLAAENLPTRPTPTCQGTLLNTGTTNAAQITLPTQTVLCPKPHIGPDVFDLVDLDADCLKNPYRCHVINQAIVKPFLVTANTEEQLATQTNELRKRNDERLRQAEENEEEERAEQIRTRVIDGIGKAVERYVEQTTDTRHIEDKFRRWIIGPHWDNHPRCLAKSTRDALISGEYVWEQYQKVELQDWAAPAIQYCRALEHELKTRLYDPCPHKYPKNAVGFTIGTVHKGYQRKPGDSEKIWHVFIARVRQSGSDIHMFEQKMGILYQQQLKDKRNLLAHGEPVSQQMAETLRDTIIGTRNQSGLLQWIIENLDLA